jgi:hypothetical protein
LDVLIFVNVIVVVIGHELVMARGPVDGERGGDEERTGQKRPEAAGLSVHGKEFVKEWRNAKIFRGPGEAWEERFKPQIRTDETQIFESWQWMFSPAWNNKNQR